MARLWTAGLFNWTCMHFLVALISCKMSIIKGHCFQHYRKTVTILNPRYVLMYTSSMHSKWVAEDYLSAKPWRKSKLHTWERWGGVRGLCAYGGLDRPCLAFLSPSCQCVLLFALSAPLRSLPYPLPPLPACLRCLSQLLPLHLQQRHQAGY